MAATFILSAGACAYGVKKVNRKFGEKEVPLMGVTAAFIFAAQMLNFPIAGGTSGHFLGAVFSSVLLGPWAGLIIMTLVLAVQCLGFADGGLTALGSNVFNMGVIGALGGYGIFALTYSFSKEPEGVFLRPGGLRMAFHRHGSRGRGDRIGDVRNLSSRDRFACHGRGSRHHWHRRISDHNHLRSLSF